MKKEQPVPDDADEQPAEAEQPGSASLEKTAQYLSLTERRVQQLAVKGVVVRAEKTGRYMLLQSGHAYIKFLQQANEQKSNPEFDKHRDDEKKHKARTAKVSADRAEREEAIIAGRYILREETIQIWQSQLRSVRSKCKRWLTELKLEVQDLSPEWSNVKDREFNQFFNNLQSDIPETQVKLVEKARRPRKVSKPYPKAQVAVKSQPPKKKVSKKRATKKKVVSKKKATSKQSKKTTSKKLSKKRSTKKKSRAKKAT